MDSARFSPGQHAPLRRRPPPVGPGRGRRQARNIRTRRAVASGTVGRKWAGEFTFSTVGRQDRRSVLASGAAASHRYDARRPAGPGPGYRPARRGTPGAHLDAISSLLGQPVPPDDTPLIGHRNPESDSVSTTPALRPLWRLARLMQYRIRTSLRIGNPPNPREPNWLALRGRTRSHVHAFVRLALMHRCLINFPQDQ